MISLKAKIFNFIVRNRHLRHGKLKKPIIDFSTSIEDFRIRSSASARRYSKIHAGVSITKQIIEGITCEWLHPEGADPSKLILYVHGGGYVSGTCEVYRGFVSKLAHDSGVSCLIFNYRLAPECPYPAALDDTVKIYNWLLQSGYTNHNILFVGDSAGGGLSLSALLALRDRKIALPVATVAVSPWTDLTCSSESYQTKNKVSAAPLNSWHVFSAYYAGNHSKQDPLMSPLFGDLEGLPPLFINAGTEDELYEDGKKFYLKAKEAGVDVIFRKGIGMIHCYPFFAPMFREATEAMEEIVGFIKNKLLV